ncbi:MAG: YbhN family protein [Bacteriovoracia bacterium]
MSKFKFILSFIFFIALTACGIFAAAMQTEQKNFSFDLIASLPWTVVSALIISSICIYLVDILRFFIFSHMIGVRLQFLHALEAAIVNLFFGWVTPGAAMGAPAAVYTLGKRGIPWDASLIICFGKSLTGFGTILLLAFVMIAMGLGPQIDNIFIYGILWSASFIAFFFIALPIVGSFYSASTHRSLDRIEQKLFSKNPKIKLRANKIFKVLKDMIERLRLLHNQRKFLFLIALVSQLLYFAAFIAPAVIVCHYFGGEISKAIPHSLIYTALAYSAPTPGGAGISEASSVIFFNTIVPAMSAAYVGVIFRGFTFYFQILMGILYFLFFGGGSAILNSKNALAGKSHEPS